MSLDRVRFLAGLPAAPKVVLAEEAEVAVEVTAEGEVTIVVEGEEAIEAEIVVVETEVKTEEEASPELEEKKEETEKVPAEISSAINARIAELKKAIEVADRKGYNDGSTKDEAIEALEQILDNLKKEDGLTKAKLYYGTLASAVFHLIPPAVVKYISKPAE